MIPHIDDGGSGEQGKPRASGDDPLIVTIGSLNAE